MVVELYAKLSIPAQAAGEVLHDFRRETHRMPPMVLEDIAFAAQIAKSDAERGLEELKLEGLADWNPNKSVYSITNNYCDLRRCWRSGPPCNCG